MLRRLRSAIAIALLAATPLAAGNGDVVADLPACNAGDVWELYLAFESSDTDCTDDLTNAGSTVAKCCCANGSIYSCKGDGSGGGGSSDSFKTIDLPSGTDPVADSSTDTLAVTCAAPLTCTGNSTTDTWALAWTATPLLAADVDTSAELRAILTDEVGTGALAFVGASASSFFGSGTVDTARLGSGTANSGSFLRGDQTWSARGASLNNPPASPSSYDDEFESTTLDASWTVTATSGNSTSAASIDLIGSPTSPRRDLTTVPGWLMWQSDSTGSGAAFTKSWTEDTTSMLLARCTQNQMNFSSSQEGSVHIGFTNSGDNNESVFIWANTTGSALVFRIQVQNNGSFSEATTSNLSEVQPLSPFYLLIVRSGSTYYGFVAFDSAPSFTFLGQVTKTGVTSFDEIRIVFLGANEVPSPIMGCDFIRVESQTNYPTISR